MTNKTINVDCILSAMENCLNTPLIINKKSIKDKIKSQQTLVKQQEKLYLPKINQRFKQFTI